MNKPNLNVIDIYPEMIQDAYALCEEILKDYGYTEQQFFEYVQEDLEEEGLLNLSNRLVDIMFRITRELIRSKGTDEADYWVNGTQDTHFYINGEPQ